MNVETFPSASEFLAVQRSDLPGCLVLDVQQQLTRVEVQIPIIFITGHGDIPMSVRAMKAGAAEFLTKPFRDQVLIDAIRQCIERDRAAASSARRSMTCANAMVRLQRGSET